MIKINNVLLIRLEKYTVENNNLQRNFISINNLVLISLGVRHQSFLTEPQFNNPLSGEK